MAAPVKQFIALPFVVGGTFVMTALVTLYVASKFTNWTEPFVGPVSAIAVVSVTFWFAPARKNLAGMCTLLIGSAFAWFLLRHSYYPELHPRAYQPTLLPFWTTIAGGLLGYVFCWVLWRHDIPTPRPNEAPASNPGLS